INSIKFSFLELVGLGHFNFDPHAFNEASAYSGYTYTFIYRKHTGGVCMFIYFYTLFYSGPF
ncbi:MAG: hypothetical protein QGI44_07570, partial [Candidatus Marinimicrobia bacterium]|nr:hypothetical protein [Candidatus Neomarinimicrobiota bacterium]